MTGPAPRRSGIAGAVAARGLALPAELRENTGVMAPSHELRLGLSA